MNSSRKYIVAASAILVATWVSSASGEDEIRGGKEDHAWARFHPGSWIRIERSTKSGKNEWKETRTETLISIVEKELTVRIETKEKGRPAETREEKGAIGNPEKVTWKEIGMESLKLQGKEVECRVLERDTSKPKGTVRSWRGIVDGKDVQLKKVSHQKRDGGGVNDSSWTLVTLHESVKIGADSIDCRVEEVLEETKDAESKVESKVSGRFWLSDRVPGGFVKWESTFSHGDEESRSTESVVEFHVVKSE